jgi:hypothetical protein
MVPYWVDDMWNGMTSSLLNGVKEIATYHMMWRSWDVHGYCQQKALFISVLVKPLILDERNKAAWTVKIQNKVI